MSEQQQMYFNHFCSWY